MSGYVVLNLSNELGKIDKACVIQLNSRVILQSECERVSSTEILVNLRAKWLTSHAL